MSDTPESTGLFAKRYIDLRATTALTDVITSQLRDVGLVTLDGLQSRAAVVALASALMRIAPHRDSEPDGLTVVQDTGRHTARSGFAGLTNVELAAHTERSGAPAPPRLMLLACGRPAASGGECVLIDGHDVYTDLARHHPDAAEALSDERAGLFGGQNGTFSPVFRHHPSDRISIRLRLDDLALWNPLARRFIPALTAAISRHRQAIRLDTGDAYLLDNHRWLHARTAFTGPRLLYRALGTPFLAMSEGFPIDAPRRWLPPLSELTR
ncbi:TauD/TfdA family dioxygenase [Streptomyces sp. NBC_00448]|uniref:TauD/TfdA family dioxygenase n=1 Tax=Streptomyces sp. NBC_00448 TaxID=2903652 RepID=UPI002E24EB1E